LNGAYRSDKRVLDVRVVCIEEGLWKAVKNPNVASSPKISRY